MTSSTDLRGARLLPGRALDDLRARISELNGLINALVAFRPWDAVGRDIRRGTTLPLGGLLLSVKDTFDLAGTRSTAGSTRFADRIPDTTAVAVQRLIEQGGVPFAKSNVPSLAGDLVTDNRIFGRTHHPEDESRTPGGSSGGGAAAVASGMAPVDVCSDLGGSARLPAHYCGIFGHKLTYGLVPLTGHVPPLPGNLAQRDLACAGVLAARHDDLAAAVRALAAPAHSERFCSTPSVNAHQRSESSWRVAACLTDPFLPTPAPHVDAISHALTDFEGRTGSLVDTIDRPGPATLEEYDEIFRYLLVSDASSILDDDRFTAGVALAANLPVEDGSPVTTDLKASAALHRDWLLANERRYAMRAELLTFFGTYDALICPVSPILAPFHPTELDRYHRVADDGCDRIPYLSQMTWSAPATIAYLPATVAPVGRVRGLPLGVQVIGPPLSDLSVIELAGALAQEPLPSEQHARGSAQPREGGPQPCDPTT